MKKKHVDLRFLYLFIPMMLLEMIFHIIQFNRIDIFTLIRYLLFTLFLSCFICFICTRFKSRKVYYYTGLIYLILFCCYSFAELIFKNFMGDFYSFGTVGDGAARIAQYATIFISNGKPSYYLLFLSVIVYVLLNKFVVFNSKGPYQLTLIICISSFLLMIPTANLGSGAVSIRNTYLTFNNKTIIIDKFGIEHFLFRDLSALYFTVPESVDIDIIEDETETEPVETIRQRKIDDTMWKSIAENEENSNMQTIDKYLMAQKITPANEKTGVYEGYNFIYFMVEGMDYLSIDKDLTPTLYKMYSEGNTFYNHYTPLYSCATGESEFVGYTSIFPYVNVCTPNYIAGDLFYEALPFLFKNKGYSTFSLHNWRDEFYERKLIHPGVGFDNYTDIDDIWKDTSIEHTNGWQSDAMLVEQAIKQIDATNGKFFCDIVTSVMHFPYDESSYWGDYYLDEINEVHPDWPIDYKRYLSKCMNFDEGLRILLEYLDEKGLADNTVIAIYPDHRPYWLNYDTVMEYTNWINHDRVGENGIYRSPFIIYNKNMTPEVNYNYCSTLDQVPTLANMFALDYDPRLYMGSDIYDGSKTVFFTNGNWITDLGWYDAVAETFYPNEGVDMPSDTYVTRNTTYVQNTMKISYLILDEVYFSQRRSICYPKY